MSDIPYTHGVPILFWSEKNHPKDFCGQIIPPSVRRRMVAILRAGYVRESYFGWAVCRLCGQQLGCQDLGDHGFVWPERAEHYLEKHELWHPSLDHLLSVVGGAVDPPPLPVPPERVEPPPPETRKAETPKIDANSLSPEEVQKLLWG